MKMLNNYYRVTFVLLVVCIVLSTENLQDDINSQRLVEKSLSRKRRYLTFPPGSSLQMVYCLTFPSVAVGQIFTFGSTAALAWELPTEPDQVFQLFGKGKFRTTTTTTTTPEPTWPSIILDHDSHEHEAHPSASDRWSRNDNYYVDPMKKYYSRPLFGSSRNYNGYTSANENNTGYTYATHQQPYTFNEAPVTSYLHPVYHQVHRRTRRDLYEKVEKLFMALGRDGKGCLLKTICEVTKIANTKGSFMEEILKAVFQIKPHPQYPNEDHYDTAADPSHDCEKQYPSCEHSIWTNMFK